MQAPAQTRGTTSSCGTCRRRRSKHPGPAVATGHCGQHHACSVSSETWLACSRYRAAGGEPSGSPRVLTNTRPPKQNLSCHSSVQQPSRWINFDCKAGVRVRTFVLPAACACRPGLLPSSSPSSSWSAGTRNISCSSPHVQATIAERGLYQTKLRMCAQGRQGVLLGYAQQGC